MKKTIALIMAGLLVLAVGTAVIAAEPAKAPMGMNGMNCPGGHKMMQLTDEQRQEMLPLMNQMMEIKKQMLAKQVAWGNLTQEQADQMIAHMQDRMAKGPGAGPMMGGPGKMHGGHGGFGGQGQTPPCLGQQAPDKTE
ncbi:MAG TPA: DUF2680 domain-containing protein [Patescibacteria group bacterium]|nr:DUF2680 domain-containing protein [Patescibacteria group bacterium]